MVHKLLSRKLWVAVVTFVALYVTPNLSASTQARLQAGVAVVYLIAQGLADAFGGGKPSQGEVGK